MAGLLLGEEKGILRAVSDTPPSHYAVKLQRFSLLTKNNIDRYSTAEFEAGGYRWKLILYPNGNKSRNSSDNISIYLMVAQSSLGHPRLEVYAVFKVFLLDQNNDNYYTLGVANARRFHKMKLEWGFDQFMPLKTFNDPSNGYLVDDTCVFGAEVYVCKENSTGKGEHLAMIKDANTYKHTWKLEGFSSIATEDVHDSMPFNAGDQKWKIQMHPKGKGTGTGSHISLYLALADPTTLPIGSQIYAEFTVRILDQMYGKNYFGKVNHWFSASNPVYGWQRFISLSYFTPSGNGFLVKDNCIIEAEVTIHGTTTAL